MRLCKMARFGCVLRDFAFFVRFCALLCNTAPSGPHAVESLIAVEDAIENHGLYRVFVSRLF